MRIESAAKILSDVVNASSARMGRPMSGEAAATLHAANIVGTAILVSFAVLATALDKSGKLE